MRMKMERTSLLVLIVLFITFAGCQRGKVNAAAENEQRGLNPNGNNPGKVIPEAGVNGLSPDERDLAYQLEASNLEEVGLAGYMQERSKNVRIRNFANMILEDHGKAVDDIRELLKNNGITEPETQTPKGELSKLTALRNSPDSDVDREYIRMMIEDHQARLGALRNEQSSVQSSVLKQYIGNLIPIIEKHLRAADSIENGI